MSGESEENFEVVTKFLPDILSPDQNFYPIFLSPTEIFTQNSILQPKMTSRFLHPELLELVKETNSFGQFSRLEVTKL